MARASPSGRSARWSAAAAACSRPTTRRRPGRRSPRRRRVRPRRRRAPLDRAGAADAARRRVGDRLGAAVRGVADLLRAARRDGARRHGLRGPPLGRSGPARLRRPPARLEPRRPDLRRHAGPTGADRAPSGLGRQASGTSHRCTSSPLAEEAMRELLAGLVPGLPEPAVRAIVVARRRASRCTPSRRSGCSSPRAGSTLARRSVCRPVGDLTSLAVPATLTALIASRLDALEPDAPRARLGCGGARPELHRRVRSPRVSGSRRRDAGADAPTRSCGARSSSSRPTRGRPSAASTPSSRRSSARSRMRRWPEPTARCGILRPPVTSNRLGSDELAGALAGHYLAAYANAPEGPERDALASQARIALRAAPSALRASVLTARPSPCASRP